MKRNLMIAIAMLGISLCGCKENADINTEDWQRLDMISDIAVEIQQASNIECQAYYKITEDAGQIELYVPDCGFDHQSLANEISKLKSVQSFKRDLYAVFRHTPEGSDSPSLWVKYDARTGRPADR